MMLVTSLRLRTLVALPVLLLLSAGFTHSIDSSAPPARPGFHPIQEMYYLKKVKPDVKRVGVIWKKGAPQQKKKLNSLKRAIASIQGELFLGYVQDKSDVGEKFRLLTRKHDVQAIWIVENDGVVDSSAPQTYLIKNAVKEGIPLLAPSKEWVSAGAPIAVTKSGDEYQILLNEAAANATALKVPDEFKSKTKLIAAAN